MKNDKYIKSRNMMISLKFLISFDFFNPRDIIADV